MKMLLSFKHRSILLTVLVFSMLFTVSCKDEEPAGPDLIAEGYNLMSTFLNESLTGGKIVVDQETSNPLAWFWVSGGDLAENVESLKGYVPAEADPGLIEQMLILSQDTTLHEDRFRDDKNEIVLMTPEDKARIFSTERTAVENWEEFHREFDYDQELFVLSRAAFNEDRTQALFAVIDYYITPRGYVVAYGSLVFFKKLPDSNEWDLDHNFTTVWVLG